MYYRAEDLKELSKYDDNGDDVSSAFHRTTLFIKFYLQKKKTLKKIFSF